MVSCGADKSIIFREVTTDRKGLPEFARGNHVVGKTTLYDMEVDATAKHVLTACQDRNIRVYTVGNGKHSRLEWEKTLNCTMHIIYSYFTFLKDFQGLRQRRRHPDQGCPRPQWHLRGHFVHG